MLMTGLHHSPDLAFPSSSPEILLYSRLSFPSLRARKLGAVASYDHHVLTEKNSHNGNLNVKEFLYPNIGWKLLKLVSTNPISMTEGMLISSRLKISRIHLKKTA